MARAVKKAGFDGMTVPENSEISAAALSAGLTIVGSRDIGAVKDVEPYLLGFKKSGITHINFQLCDHDTPIKKSLPIAIKIMETGDRLKLKPAIEVHRDTCTETPEKAFALADAYQARTGKKLRMNFDHSHPAIIKHLHVGNYWERLGVRLDLLTMGEMIHLRPFNGHHCQIPITNGHGGFTPEFEDWLPFCDKLIETWIKAARPGQELVATPELGSRPYALSCFPDIWIDAQVVAREIRKIWNKHIKSWKPRKL